jgi:hypothetical protein
MVLIAVSKGNYSCCQSLQRLFVVTYSSLFIRMRLRDEETEPYGQIGLLVLCANFVLILTYSRKVGVLIVKVFGN